MKAERLVSPDCSREIVAAAFQSPIRSERSGDERVAAIRTLAEESASLPELSFLPGFAFSG